MPPSLAGEDDRRHRKPGEAPSETVPGNGPLTVWHRCHTFAGMKMTMHIDEELLARVMAVTGAGSKTQAVDLALREVDRRGKLINMALEGLGLEVDELKDAVDPAYDLEKIRRMEVPTRYGRKSRSR